MKAYLCRRKLASLKIKNESVGRKGGGFIVITVQKPIGRIELDLKLSELSAFETSQFGDAAENWSLLSKLKKWMSSCSCTGEPGIQLTLERNNEEKPNLNYFEMVVTLEGSLLDKLVKNLEHLNLKITLQIYLTDEVTVVESRETTLDCDFSEMLIRSGGEGQLFKGAFCKQISGEISEKFSNQWIIADRNKDNLIDVEVSLILSASRKRIDCSGAEGAKGEEGLSCLDINRRLLKDEVRTDLEIIPGNGKAVKCLSAFLVVQSEVIKAMLESDMLEKKERRIVMENVSENGVRALLAYLYCRDLELPEKNSVLAMELLEISHQYLIGGLEEAIQGILLDKPVKWFEASAAVRLFYFAGKLDHCMNLNLKMKAVQVLQSKPTEVIDCEEFQRLFQLEGEVGGMEGIGARLQGAKELCEALMLGPMLATSSSFTAAAGKEKRVLEQTTSENNGVTPCKRLRIRSSRSNNK